MVEIQRRHDEQADQRQQRADAVRAEILGEARDRHQRGGIHRQTGVLQADEADEQADADGNAALERQRDGVEDRLAHVRQAQHDEDQTLDKDGQQRDLPRVAHAQHDGVGQKRIEAHARGQRERQIRHQRHAGRADEGGQRRRQQHGGSVHPRGGQDARVNGQNVGHGHKCGDTRHHFGFGGGFVFAQLKDLFKHSFHSLLFFFRSPTFSTGRDCILAHFGGSFQCFSEFLSSFFCETFGFLSFPRLRRKNGRAPPAPHAESAVQARIARPLCCFWIERLFAPRLSRGGAREADGWRYAISALQASTSSAFSLAESSGCLAFVLT